jgi:hypothetical protein
MDLKSLRLPEQIFNSLRHLFHALSLKKRGFVVFHSTLFLRLMNDSWRSISSIGPVHVTIDFLFGSTLSIWPTQAWRQLLPDHCHYFKLSVIGTISVACLIFRQVSIDHRCSGDDLWLLLINCKATAIRDLRRHVFFRIKTWKRRWKPLKKCSCYTKFF